jgi:hypothetical protein
MSDNDPAEPLPNEPVSKGVTVIRGVVLVRNRKDGGDAAEMFIYRKLFHGIQSRLIGYSL